MDIYDEKAAYMLGFYPPERRKGSRRKGSALDIGQMLQKKQLASPMKKLQRLTFHAPRFAVRAMTAQRNSRKVLMR